MSSEDDPDPRHAILPNAHEYAIGELRYHTGLDGSEPFLELTLERAGDVRRLRFWSPRDLVIEEGFPMPTHGMIILDVSRRQLEGLWVQVDDFEDLGGSITFWARDVADLDIVEAD